MILSWETIIEYSITVSFGIFLMAGLVFAVVYNKLNWPEYSVLIFFAAAILFSLGLSRARNKNKNAVGAVIEEEDI